MQNGRWRNKYDLNTIKRLVYVRTELTAVTRHRSRINSLPKRRHLYKVISTKTVCHICYSFLKICNSYGFQPCLVRCDLRMSHQHILKM